MQSLHGLHVRGEGIEATAPRGSSAGGRRSCDRFMVSKRRVRAPKRQLAGPGATA